MSIQFNDVQMIVQTQQQQSYPSYLSIPKIRVIVRKRPLSKKELAKGDSDVVETRTTEKLLKIVYVYNLDDRSRRDSY